MSSSQSFPQGGQPSGSSPDWRPVALEDGEEQIRAGIEVFVWVIRQSIAESLFDQNDADQDPRVQLAVALKTIHLKAHREFGYSFFRDSVNKLLPNGDATKVWPTLVTVINTARNELSTAALTRKVPMVVFVQYHGEHRTKQAKFQPWIRLKVGAPGDVTLPRLNLDGPSLTARQYLEKWSATPFDPGTAYEASEPVESRASDNANIRQPDATNLAAGKNRAQASDAQLELAWSSELGTLAGQDAQPRPAQHPAVSTGPNAEPNGTELPLPPHFGEKSEPSVSPIDAAARQAGSANAFDPSLEHGTQSSTPGFGMSECSPEGVRAQDPLLTELQNAFIEDILNKRQMDRRWRRGGEAVVGILVLFLVLVAIFHLTLPLLEAHGIVQR